MRRTGPDLRINRRLRTKHPSRIGVKRPARNPSRAVPLNCLFPDPHQNKLLCLLRSCHIPIFATIRKEIGGTPTILSTPRGPPFVNGFAYACTGQYALRTHHATDCLWQFVRTGAGKALLGTFAAGAVVFGWRQRRFYANRFGEYGPIVCHLADAGSDDTAGDQPPALLSCKPGADQFPPLRAPKILQPISALSHSRA